jgi:hypothetical protein
MGLLRNTDQLGCILSILFNASHIQSPDIATAKFQSAESTREASERFPRADHPCPKF